MTKRYTQSFKLAVINQVIVDGQSIRGTAKANGINPVTLSRWLKLYREQYTHEATTQDNNEILKSRLEEVIFER